MLYIGSPVLVHGLPEGTSMERCDSIAMQSRPVGTRYPKGTSSPNDSCPASWNSYSGVCWESPATVGAAEGLWLPHGSSMQEPSLVQCDTETESPAWLRRATGFFPVLHGEGLV